jgi:glycosyltransferase involved in cell wall biosynthesis
LIVAECLTNSGSGGGQQLVYQLVQTLKSAMPDIQVSVILPSGGVFVQRFEALGVDVRQIALNSLSLTSARELSNALDEIRPDVIHSHGKGAGFHARRATSRARHVHSFHGFYPPAGVIRRGLYLRLEQRLSKRTDRFLLVSESEKSDVVAAIPGAAAKISVISNIVDVSRVREMAESTPDPTFAEFLSRNKGRIIVAMVGRTDAVKNHALALSAAKLLLDENARIAFAFIGLEPAYTPFADLRLKYSERLFAIGHVENVPAIVKCVDVMMMTSKNEASVPLALSEGFALGKPAVGTNVPGIRDAIVDRQNGLLCAETAEGLSSAIRALVNAPTLLQQISEGARAAGERQKINDWARSYYQVYHDLLSG